MEYTALLTSDSTTISSGGESSRCEVPIGSSALSNISVLEPDQETVANSAPVIVRNTVEIEPPPEQTYPTEKALKLRCINGLKITDSM
ncbi:hypothetical protein F442_22498 [Phytophthora nicotianae P10297]|uniref:Uncharacterized protein n=3 Tax=Phytophthora nicotianae TaxID=4792 RepID=W2XZE6_PHYNI|nr:hypothetical protein L917_21629 [Phytophthora nicotianae]ETO59211.1 hypothetical protein F444_22409 [Phytophthora nicotianae P1976]ETP28210.1 hypothetical protein F442_22498 [Phytophthora nicotianae P10297]